MIHSPVALTDDHTVSDTEGNKDGLLVLYTHHDMFGSFLFVFLTKKDFFVRTIKCPDKDVGVSCRTVIKRTAFTSPTYSHRYPRLS